MRLYGDMLSPFVRMCFVTAHEVGLGDKVIHERESVTPTPLRDPSRTLHVQAQKFAFPVSHVQAAIEQYRCGPDFTAGYLGASNLFIA
mgnify:CR=1 FL=1